MKLAIISDIHGNYPALREVMHDINNQDIDLVLCTGDLVGYGAFPNEVIEMVRRNRIPTVMGNYDDGVGNDRSECGCAYTDPKMAELGHRSLAWTKQHVSSENKSYLKGLLQRLEFTVFGRKILLVHGSPRKINEYLFEDRPEESVERLLETENVDIMICGHTHLPYVRNINGRYLINAGSVGKPKDGDVRAGYVVLTVSEDSVSAQINRVNYDVDSAAIAIEAADLPDEFAADLRRAGH